jgi:hypothetical protein
MKNIFVVYYSNPYEEYDNSTDISYWEKEEDAKKEVELLIENEESEASYFYLKVEMNVSEV